MVPSVLIKIADSGSVIYRSVESARELRDFLMTEESVTPIAEKLRVATKTKK